MAALVADGLDRHETGDGSALGSIVRRGSGDHAEGKQFTEHA